MTGDDEAEADAFARWYDQAQRDPVFRKWMEQEFDRRVAARPSPSSQVVTRAFLNKRLDSSLELVGRFLAEHLKPLQKRVAELESVSLKDRGVWRRLGTYAESDVVSDRGSAWVCKRAPHGVRPGEGDAWRLLFKTEHPRKERP